MIHRIPSTLVAMCGALLLIAAISIVATAPRNVAAQDPDPEDPFEGAELFWYASFNPGGFYQPGDFLVTSTVGHTGDGGFWQMEPNWAALYAWWNGLSTSQQNSVSFGIFVPDLVRDAGTQAHLVAGIWQPDSDPWSTNPAQAFRYLDARFFEDTDASHLYTPSIDASLGDDETGVAGDALCPAPGCPYTFGFLPGTSLVKPIGLTFKFRMVPMTSEQCPMQYSFRLTTAPGIPDYYGRNALNYDCLTALEGQVWNCFPEANCATFEN